MIQMIEEKTKKKKTPDKHDHLIDNFNGQLYIGHGFARQNGNK